MAVELISLETPAGEVPATVEGSGETGILLAPGAGTDQHHFGISGLRTRLAAAGFIVMTFDYAYRAEGRSFPDRLPKLLSVHRTAAQQLRSRVGGRLVLAGRSMGGRMGTLLAAGGEECAAIVAYGYPLHPAGKPERLRVDHLADMVAPALFLTGTRDALALPHLVTQYLCSLPTATVELIDDADHSFRRRGTPAAEMLDTLAEMTVLWLRTEVGLGEMTVDPP